MSRIDFIDNVYIYTQAYDGYIYLMDKVYLLTILIELESCQILENMS